jgi:hypothetical protein
MNNTKLELVHIPKTGGMSIEDAASLEGILWGYKNPEIHGCTSKTRASYNGVTRWHVPPKCFLEKSPYQGKDTFCVIRDPIDRLVSAYKYSFKMGKHRNKNINLWIKNNFKQNGVSSIAYDGHLDPQVNYIFDDNGNRTCRYVIPFNSLVPGVNKLMEMYFINARLSESVVHNASTMNVNVSHLNEESKRILTTFYKTDIDTYNKFKSHMLWDMDEPVK